MTWYAAELKLKGVVVGAAKDEPLFEVSIRLEDQRLEHGTEVFSRMTGRV